MQNSSKLLPNSAVWQFSQFGHNIWSFFGNMRSMNCVKWISVFVALGFMTLQEQFHCFWLSRLFHDSSKQCCCCWVFWHLTAKRWMNSFLVISFAFSCQATDNLSVKTMTTEAVECFSHKIHCNWLHAYSYFDFHLFSHWEHLTREFFTAFIYSV